MENKVRRRLLLVTLYSLIIVLGFSIYSEVKIISLWQDSSTSTKNTLSSQTFKLSEYTESKILTREKAIDKYSEKQIGNIYIPRIQMEADIIQGASNSDEDMQRAMKQTVGHEPESYLPGEGHQVILSGHREEQFGALEKVEKGDIIIVEILDNTFLYEVKEMKVVLPSGEDAIKYVRGESDSDTLVLYTCYPFTPLSLVTHRYVVKAKKVEDIKLTLNQAKKLLTEEVDNKLNISTDVE